MRKPALKQALKYIVPEYKLILIKERKKVPYKIKSPDMMAPLVEPMRHLPEEQFVCFHLNAQMEVIGFQIISHGTVTESLVHPREVFKGAILCNSHSILVAHNHPSNSIKPSEEDWKITETLISAGKMLGIPLIDHLIVTTHDDIVSLRELDPSIF